MIRLSRKGFTLVEIMIVVAIIALLAAIAIPNIMRARLNANENATVSSLKTCSASLQSFASHNIVGGAPSFPATLGTITNATLSPEPGYLDDTWGAAAVVKSGYAITYTPVANAATRGNTQFWIDAIPAAYQTTGVRSFYIDEQGVVYGLDNAGAAAGAHGTPAGWAVVE